MFVRSLKTTKIYLIIISCLDTGAVAGGVMDSMESKSVINGLLRIRMRFGKMTRIAEDQGINLLAFDKLAEESKRLLELEAVTSAPVESQYRNYVEQGIQVIKKLVTVMTRTLKNEKLPILEREGANLLLEIACYEANGIPCAKYDDFLYICPNDIICPNME